jgi:hypothetical protein
MTFIRSNIVSIIIFIAGTTSAQDTIFLKNGIQLPAKVTEVFQDSVKFISVAQQDSIPSMLPADSLLSIKYANGKIETFKQKKIESKIINVFDSPAEMYAMGKSHAKIFYKGRGAFWFTFLATSPAAFSTGSLYTVPLPGFTTGAIFASTNPKRIIVPDQNLLNNPYYIKGYMKEAKKKRLGKAAAGFGLGIAVDVSLIYLFLTSLKE